MLDWNLEHAIAMPSPAVLLVSDSNFFYRSWEGNSVFDLIRAATPGIACYGIWERYLGKVTSKLKDMLAFILALGVQDVMIVLCLGQHDVLAAKQQHLSSAVSNLVTLMETFNARLVVVELFDHSAFASSAEAYASGVAGLNLLWKHEAWPDPAIEVLSTAFINDTHFINDQMHLNPEGMQQLCAALVPKINSFCLPQNCLS